jgi:MFS family permease
VIKNYRFVVALLLFAAGTINYMDRAAIGVVAPYLQESFSLSPSQLGLSFNSFFIGYAIFAFVGGQLADRFGPRRTYTWAALSRSILCGLTGAVTGFIQLLAVRTVFGFAEGPMNSTTNRAITNWFPREETARAVGFTFSGQTLGSAVAAPRCIASLLLCVFTSTTAGAVALLSIAIMLLTTSVQSCWATIHELVPATRLGGVSGFVHLLSNISGIIGPTATGLAVQHLGGYNSAFFLASGIALAGVVAMTICVRRHDEPSPLAVPVSAV